MRTIVAVIILAVPLSVQAQIEQFSVKELQEDLTFLKSSIEKFNPALYKYNHKAEFEHLFHRLYQSIDVPLTRLEFFKAVSLLTAGAREGHLGVGSINNKASEIYSGFFDGSFQCFPVSLTFLNKRAYILNNHGTDVALQKGWEVLEINHEKIADIVEKLLPFISADGDIITSKYHHLKKYFPILYYWYVDQPAKFKLKVRPTGSSAPVTIDAEASDFRYVTGSASYPINHVRESPEFSDELYMLKLEEDLAILKLKSFNRQLMEKHGITARELCKSTFKKLADAEVENLILDLRDNGGGSRAFVQEIVPYILKERHQGMLYQTISYLGKMKTYPMPSPAINAFKGKLYVLINGGSFSNGSVIARFAKEFADAIIIGEESGSRYEGFATGSLAYIHLPNTLIEVRIPGSWIRYGHQNKQNTSNRGVLPHYTIHYSIDEILNHKDKELEKAKSLIRGR